MNTQSLQQWCNIHFGEGYAVSIQIVMLNDSQWYGRVRLDKDGDSWYLLDTKRHSSIEAVIAEINADTEGW